MRLINSSAKAILQDAGTDTVNTLVGIYKQIELAGRTCYKSEDKITPTSAKEFVDRMINSKHYAMLEHGTVYLIVPINDTTKTHPDAYKLAKEVKQIIDNKEWKNTLLNA